MRIQFFWLFLAALLVFGIAFGGLDPWALAALGVEVGVALGIVCLVLIPIHFRFSNWQTANPVYEPVDFEPGVSAVEGVVARDIGRAVAELAPEGFEVRGHFYVPRPGQRVSAIVTLFENRGTQEIAELIIAASSLLRQTTLILWTRFADGSEVTTSNNRLTVGLPKRPGQIGVWLPEVRDGRALYQIHKEVVDRLGTGMQRLPCIEDPAAFLRKSSLEVLSHFAAAGYYYLDKPGGKYRPTWKGAFLMSWRSIWPISFVYRALKRRQTRNLLNQLGIR